MWTSRAYDHSTEESAGVEWEGGETRTRFEKNLEKIYGQRGGEREWGHTRGGWPSLRRRELSICEKIEWRVRNTGRTHENHGMS